FAQRGNDRAICLPRDLTGFEGQRILPPLHLFFRNVEHLRILSWPAGHCVGGVFPLTPVSSLSGAGVRAPAFRFCAPTAVRVGLEGRDASGQNDKTAPDGDAV